MSSSGFGLSHFDERSGLVECKTPFGCWFQTVQEVTVEVKLKEDTKGKEVTLDIRPSSIKCVVKGETIFEGPLFDTIVEDESTWTIEDRRLVRILLVKANPRKDKCWTSLLKGGKFAPDAFILNEMRKKLDLEQFQLENPGFDFSNAKLDKKYDEKYLRQMKNELGAKD